MVVIKVITFSYALSGRVHTGLVCTRYKSKPTWEEQLQYYLQFCYNATSTSFFSFEWGDLETLETVESYEDLDSSLQKYMKWDVMVHCGHSDYSDDYFMFRADPHKRFFLFGSSTKHVVGSSTKHMVGSSKDLPQGGHKKS